MSLDYRLKFTKFEENRSKVAISRAQIYWGLFGKKPRIARFGCTGRGSVRRYRQIQKVNRLQTVALARSYPYVLSMIFCILAKLIYLCEMNAVLQFWRLHHTSQRQLSIGKLHCLRAGDHCYGQRSWARPKHFLHLGSFIKKWPN